MNNEKDIDEEIIIDIVKRTAEEAPNRIAVKWVEENGSAGKDYRTFWKDIQSCAEQYFVCNRNQRIALCGKQDYRYLVLLMAIWYSGNSAVIVTDHIENSENREILEDIQTAVYVSYDGIDVNFCEDPRFESVRPLSDIGSQKEAVVLLTSGTTGRKKCVSLSHRNLLFDALATLQIVAPNLTLESAQSYGCLPFSHAFALQANIFCPFAVGGTVCLGTNPARFLEELTVLKPGYCIVVPQIVQYILNFFNMNGSQHFDSFPILLCGGAAIGSEEIEMMAAYGITVLQGYGTTECSPIISVNSPLDNRPDTAGKVLEGVSVCIRDNEILVKGDNVFHGYLSNSENQESIFDDGYYRTGDAGWMDADGYLHVTGRIKNTIVLPNGENVDPEALESRLMATPVIIDAYVYEHRTDDISCIAAMIYSDRDSQTVIETVRAVNRTLESCEQIRLVEFAETPLERTALGKIRRNQNCRISKTEKIYIERNNTEYVAPSTPLEESLCAIFASVLEMEKVSVKDNFFECGGHSLRAVRLTNRIESELHFRVKVQDIFAYPDVRRLANYIEVHGAEELMEADSIPKAEAKRFYPMSSQQKRMYLNDLIDKDSLAYHICVGYDVSGHMEMEKLERCLNELVAKRSAFRTAFSMEGEEFLQEIVENVVFHLEVSETEEGFVRPFDLSTPPQLRVRYVKREEGDRLLVDMPHIVSDGASMTLFMRDLFALYQGESITSEHLHYGDYSEWMNNRNLSSQKQFWLNLYANQPQPLQIQTDFARPKEHSQRGSSVFRNIEKKELRSFASSNRMTDYMVFLSGLMILMGKYGNTDDVVIGSPIHGRTTKDSEEIYGMFVNTLALRGYPSEEKKIATFLEEMAHLCVSSYDNQEYPFEELVEALKIDRDLSRNPLFDIMLVLQNNEKAFKNSDDVVSIDDVVLTRSREKRYGSKFDLSFSVRERDEFFEVELEYCTDLFTEETATRFLEHFENVLHAMTKPETVRISDITVSSEKEKNWLLSMASGEKTEDRDETLVSLLQKSVIQNSDRVAVRAGETTLTFRELNNLANGYANEMHAQGVNGNDCVAIIGERCLKTVAVCFAVLKCGASFIIIDDLLPEERKDRIISDANAKIVIRAFAGDDLSFATENREINCFVTPDMPAYLIYTSGTSGQPKGVVCRHRGVVNMILWLMKEHPFTENAKVLEKTNLSFVDSVYEMFWPLCAGRELVILPQGDEMYPDRLLRAITKYQITNLILVPTVFNELLSVSEEQEMPDSLRLVILSGEPLKAATVKRARKILNPDCTLINQYGQTEGGFSSTHYELRMDTETPESWSVMPIGRSIQNVSHYILKGDKLCGIGVPGQICIYSEGLALGYVADAKMTETKFVPNPLGEGIICQTGDYGIYLPDGNIMCLGRMDNQIKIRGQRIELGEIENVIRGCEGVKDCAVIAEKLKDDSLDYSIIAYLVTDSLAEIDSIKDYVKKTLPRYMVPMAFMKLEAILHTRNGKVDKKALPKPQPVQETSYEKPQTRSEEIVSDMFASVLDFDRVSVSDDFFSLGGHSLKAAYLCNRISDAFSVSVEIRDIFANPTPRKLAAYIDNLPRSVSTVIPKAEKKAVYPLTPIQKQFYMAAMSAPQSLAFNMSFEIRLEGEVDAERLQSAFSMLVRKHSALRLSFDMRDGEACQILHDDIDFEMEFPEDDNSGFFRPFDLSVAPLMRAGFVKNGSVLMLDIHHLICDAASMNLLLRDLKDLYDGKDIPDEQVCFIDYTEWIIHKDFSGQKEFWNNMYRDDVPVLTIPTDKPRLAVRTNNGENVHGHLDKERIRDFVKREEISEYMLLLTAVMITLSKYGNTDDLVIGSTHNGRTHKDIERLPGIFINNMALRGHPLPEKRIGEFISEIKSLCLDAFANREYPFTSLVEDLNIEPDASRNPLFDAMLIVQNNETEKEDRTTDSLHIGAVESKRSGSKYDMIFEIVDNNGYVINFEYNTDLYLRETACRIVRLFEVVVDEIVDGRYETIGELSNGIPEEIHFLSGCYGRGAKSFSTEDTVISRFESWVKRSPKKIVCIENERSVTYSELYDAAQKKALELICRGIGKGDVIPVIGSRNLDFIINIYAVMMSGAAFAAIEESMPEERQKAMLDELRAQYYFAGDKLCHFGENVGNIGNSDDYENVFPVLTADDIAYIHFTSGTDGKPKGVKKQHRGPVIAMDHMHEKHHLGENDVFLMSANLTYISALQQIFKGTMLGGTLVILKQGDESNAPEIIRCIREFGVTFTLIVPTVLNLILEELSDINQEENPLASLRVIDCCGEPLPPYVLGKAIDFFGPQVNFYNVYGQTETAQVTLSYHHLTEEDVRQNRVPLGTPLEATELYLVQNGHLCGYGIPGEICVGGAGLSAGYLDEQLNKEKFGFLRLPWSGEEIVVFHTGDMAYWDTNGLLIGMGRKDHQIKIHGQRLEPDDVNNAVRSLPYVKDSIVVACKNSRDEMQLCAYVVCPEADFNVRTIRYQLSKKLPRYMIPASVNRVEKIPLTNNGKIDRRALPTPVFAIHSDYVAPSNEYEEIICRCFEQVLNSERVGIKDSFFEIGGDSIAAIKLCTLLEKEELLNTKSPLTVSNVMVLQTPEEIAQHFIQYEEICFVKDIDYTHEGEPSEEYLDIVLSTSECDESKKKLIKPSSAEGYFLCNTPSGVCVKLALKKKDTVEKRNALIANVLQNTVFEYGFDAFQGNLIHFANGRKEIPVLPLSEKEGDILARAMKTEMFKYDGKHLLSRVFMTATEEEENDYLFFLIHHALYDRMSTVILTEKINRMMHGGKESRVQLPQVEDDRVEKEDVVDYAYFKKIAREVENKLQDRLFEYHITEREMTSEIKAKPICEIIKVFLSQNPLLDEFDEVPVAVVDNGRNQNNHDIIGCFLKMKLQVYNRVTDTFATVPTYDVSDMIEEGFNYLPMINYIGLFKNVWSKEKYMQFLPIDKKIKYIHSIPFGKSLLVKYPIYHENPHMHM